MWPKMVSILFVAFYGLCGCVSGGYLPEPQPSDRLSKLEEMFQAQSQQISDLTKIVHEQNMEIHNLKQEVRRLAHIVNTEDKLDSHYNLNTTQQGVPTTNKMNGEQDNTDSNLPLVVRPLPEKSSSLIRKGRLLLDNADNGGQVGVYAYLSQRELMGKHKVIVFDVIRTNVGHGYSNHSGVFTAPISGLYGFSWSLFPSHLSFGSFDILRNNNVEAVMFVDSDSANWDVTSSSMTVVLLLTQGDEVYIRSRAGYTNTGTIESSEYVKSAFACWLIH